MEEQDGEFGVFGGMVDSEDSTDVWDFKRDLHGVLWQLQRSVRRKFFWEVDEGALENRHKNGKEEID